MQAHATTPSVGHKICIRCKQVRDISDFHHQWKAIDKRHHYCRVCVKEINLERNLHLKYGMSRGQFASLLERQGGVCAICRQGEVIKSHLGNGYGLSIDHDHQTGKVRGIICAACNRGLAAFRDRSDLLQRAADYLSGAE